MAKMGPGPQLHIVVRDCSWVGGFLENINPDFVCSSDPTHHLPNGGYNCIAWAAGKKDAWWWPRNEPGVEWPRGLPFEEINRETLINFINAFRTVGYIKCKDGRFENGIEKVAIFVGPLNTPTHAARSLENGVWTSKLGNGEDIEHKTLSEIEGKEYGKAVAFMKRRFDRKPFLLERIRSIFNRSSCFA